MWSFIKLVLLFTKEKNYVQVQKQFKSENTNKKLVKNIHSIKNDPKNLQEMYAVQI